MCNVVVKLSYRTKVLNLRSYQHHNFYLKFKYTHENHSNDFNKQEPDLNRNGLYKSFRTRNRFRLRLIAVLYSIYCTFTTAPTFNVSILFQCFFVFQLK